MNQWCSIANKLGRSFEGSARAVLDQLQQSLKTFQQRLPVIQALCNETIVSRHWAKLFDVFHQANTLYLHLIFLKDQQNFILYGNGLIVQCM